jgi:hypothetical protein
MTIWATLIFSRLVPVIARAHSSTLGSCDKKKAADITFYLLVETVEQTLLVVLRNNLERRG